MEGGLMALPAIGAVVSGGARLVASAGIFEGVRRAIPKAVPALKGALSKVVNVVKRNPAKSAKAGGITGALGIGGLSISDALADAGIEDNQLQAAIQIGLLISAVAAVGQLFDIQIGQ
jgi:hypothetical protein